MQHQGTASVATRSVPRTLDLPHLEIVMKFLIPLAAAALASFAGQSYAFAGRTDNTCADCNTHVAGPRDPFTNGAKTGKFDVFTDGERVTDPRDPFTEGAHA